MINTRYLRLFLLLFVVISARSGAMTGLTRASSFSLQVHNAVRAQENEKPGDENVPMEQIGSSDLLKMKAQGNIDISLRDAVEHFIEAADRGDVKIVAATYAPEFMCVRVADEGGFVQLTREQMLAFWRNATSSPPAGQPGTHSIPTQKTTIHYAEALGDTGFVLLTRIKNIGNGWEPMFYSLVWKRQDSNWRLLREFVHQKSIPKQSLK
jgi:ketosteroid isomerase-like protein